MRLHLLKYALPLAALSVSAFAAPAQWTEVRSDHFAVLTDAGEKQGRQIVDQFERMRWMFHTLFPKMNVDPAEPISIIAVRNYKSFQTLEPAEYLAKGQLRLGGLFLKTQNRNYVLLTLDAAEDHPYATVYHEYTHLQFSGDREWMPLWLDEGLAEFVQNTDIHDKNVILGQPSISDILYLRQNQLMPVETLFKVDHNSPYYHEEQKGSVFYAQSWALTHYLEVNDHDKHLHQMNDYLGLVENHMDPVEAARKAFGDLKQLQGALAGYIHNGNYKEFVMNSAAAPLDEASYRARQVTQAEADAERADFLACVGRKQDALSLIESLLQADPKNAQAYETRGFIAFRDGDQEEARKWFGEAVKLDSQSYLANYYFAAMSIGSAVADQDASIESSLRAAIRLKPSFAPSYDELGLFFARGHRNLEEAYTLELHAIQLDRGNVGYRINASTILMTQGKYSDAIRALTMAANLAKTPAEEAMLRANMDAAKQMQENSAHTTLITNVTSIDSGSSANADAPISIPIESKPKHPSEAPSGTKHEVLGTIRHVACSGNTVMDFQVVTLKKTIALYSNNYYELDLSALGFEPKGAMNVCKDIEGFKARVRYADSSDKSVDGQVVSIELRK
jgi:tetratricopeptide (TPR) repeat protein